VSHVGSARLLHGVVVVVDHAVQVLGHHLNRGDFVNTKKRGEKRDEEIKNIHIFFKHHVEESERKKRKRKV